MRFADPPPSRFNTLTIAIGTAVANPATATRATLLVSDSPDDRHARAAIQARTAAVTNVAEYLTAYKEPAARPTPVTANHRADPRARSAATVLTSTQGTV